MISFQAVKVTFFTLCLFFFSLFSGSSISASEQLHTKFQVDYHYDTSGKLQVSHHISLTNRVSQIYVSSYELFLKGESPTNISGRDSIGPLKITTTPEPNDITRVMVSFNDEVVGKGQTLNFTLTYTGKPAVKNGQVWEIALPKITNPDTIDEYTLDLYTPVSFGQPAYISPSPQTSQDTPDKLFRHYTFTKDSLLVAGVVAAFGDFQTFSFNLKYHLENASRKKQTQTITLPPDTPYQKIFYDSISPPPQNVSTDTNGNWLATYTLKPKSTLSIEAIGQAHLLGQPAKTLTPPSQSYLDQFTQKTQHWPTDNPQIQDLANQLQTPEKIYNYVVQTLTYDYSRAKPGATRLGGAEALLHPQSAICTEFTDLFITLARAAGIPSREINGFAYTTDPKLKPLGLQNDLLHAWPEYWDPKINTWVSVDPTWGKTSNGVDFFHKLDLNHFAFVIHGTSSTQPPSAGFYKADPQSKDISVNFDTYKDYPTHNLVFTWQKPLQFFPFVSTDSKLTVSNPNGHSLSQIPIQLKPTHLVLSSPANFHIDTLPPYSTVSFPVSFQFSPIPKIAPKYLGLSSSSQTLTYNVPDQLFILWYLCVVLVSSATIIALASLALKAWSLHLQRLHR